MTLKLELETKLLYSNDLPRALFISSALHSTIKLALMDLQLGVLTQDIPHFRSEFGYMCRVLDNYTILQFQGYYKVLDLRFNNVIERSNLRELMTAEAKARMLLVQDLAKEFINPETTKQWRQLILTFLQAEDEILYPFEVRLRPEISIKMLLNAGNDWDYVIKFIYAKLEQHHLINLLLSFTLDLQNVLKVTGLQDARRIIQVIPLALSAEVYSTLEASLPNMSINGSNDPWQANGNAYQNGTTTPRFIKSPREISMRGMLKSSSSSKTA